MIMPVESAKAARHPYRCRITWMYHIDGVGYAGLMGVGLWLRDPITEKDTECKEHFDPLGGRNTQRFSLLSLKPGRFDTL
jgi:hypothetical protein